MAKDIDLMTKNAKTYNEPGSQVFKVVLLPHYYYFFFLGFSHASNNLIMFSCFTGCKHHKKSLYPTQD